MNRFARFAQLLTAFFASRLFFWGVLLVFVLQALWFVFSAVYPMAFDEEVHMGIIRVYSHHWLPFLNGQETSSDSFGAIVADPSYLYHYLMSFPYRLVAALTSSEAAQVIVLRLLNIALFTYSLYLFRTVLRRAGSSAALTNTALALFTLIPIVPMLAAHVNYDNLMMLVVAWLCLLGARIVKQVQARHISIRDWTLLLILCLLGSLVKYPVVPVLLGGAFFLLGYTGWQFRRHWRKLPIVVAESWRALSRPVLLGGMALLLLSAGLFIQRYGMNMIRYGQPVPDCDAVLNEDRCTAYGPWNRNNQLAQAKGDFDRSPVHYTGAWLYGLWHRLFFAITGPVNSYANSPELPIPSRTAIALALALFGAALFAWRRAIMPRPVLLFFTAAVMLYLALLWGEDYEQYLETGQPVAINGRYLLPLLLPLAAVLGAAAAYVLRHDRVRLLKPYIAAVVLLLFLHGGGVLTFIVRSDDSWYWHNDTVIRLNHAAQHIVSPLLVEGKDHY